ncbi:MAG: hypothetical protein PWP64_172 [Candidatus Cloacimonadota bacterium]|nr:hypothetical protein [Candidatus Cloacimonadota bacterium]
MSKKPLFSTSLVLLLLMLLLSACAEKNTAYEDADKFDLLRIVPVVGNPCDLDFNDTHLYVALDQGGLGAIDMQNYSLNWFTALTSADSSVTALNRIRQVEVVGEHDRLFLYDTFDTDDITFVNIANPDSLRPYASIRGDSQNIQDMIWRSIDDPHDNNILELLYAISETVYYGRNDGGFWMGNDFSFNVSYPIKGLEMDEDNIFVAVDQRGLFIYNRQTQQQISEISFYGYAQKLAYNNDIVYVAARHGGLQIVDVSDPAAPVLVGSYDTYGYASDIDYKDGYVAVSSGSGGTYIFDVSIPAAPRMIQQITECGYANTVRFMGDRLAIASRDLGVLFYQKN